MMINNNNNNNNNIYVNAVAFVCDIMIYWTTEWAF